MALVGCPDCDRPISTSARSCPHCGAVVKSSLFPKFMVVFIAAAGVVAFFEWKGKQEPAGAANGAAAAPVAKPDDKRPAVQKKDKEAAPPKKTAGGVQRATLGAKALKKTLANAERSQLDSVRLLAAGDVCYEYRTLNGFGGYTNGRAVLSSDGKQLVNSETMGFSRLWEKDCASAGGTEVVSSINWQQF